MMTTNSQRLALFFLLFGIVSDSEGFAFYSRPQPFASIPFRGNFNFNCTTNGTKITTTLMKEFSGKFVSLPHPSVKIKFVKRGDVFTIIDFGIPASGGYKCYASDVNGNSIEYSVFLIPNMKRLPKMSIYPDHVVTKTEGESTNFTCESASKATLTWYKMVGQSDIPVPANKIATINSVTKKQVILMIKNAQMSDNGGYKCILTFVKRQKFDVTELKILKKIPVQILSNTQYLEVKAGQEARLECILQGYPVPQIRWYKLVNSKEIVLPSCGLNAPRNLHHQCKGSKYTTELKAITQYINYTASLRISKLTYPADNQMYYCKADNALGTSKAYMFLVVQAPPVLHKARRHFKGPPYAIECQAYTGNPTVPITWEIRKYVGLGYKWVRLSTKTPGHRVKIIKNPRKYWVTSRLLIPMSISRAHYRCTVSNVVGTDKLVIQYVKSSS